MSEVNPGQHPPSARPAARRAWRQDQRRTDRKSPRFSSETIERIARNAQILEVRVQELHEVLVATARAGKVVKVRPAIDAKGWPNEELIRMRFAEVYGATPKAYANAYRPCAACGQLDLTVGCEGCTARAKIQKGGTR